jgi:hypothetical protein
MNRSFLYVVEGNFCYILIFYREPRNSKGKKLETKNRNFQKTTCQEKLKSVGVSKRKHAENVR